MVPNLSWQPTYINCTHHISKMFVINTVAVISNLYADVSAFFRHYSIFFANTYMSWFVQLGVRVPQVGNHWTIPKPVLHTVPSSAPSFNFQHFLSFLRSPSGCLHLLFRLPFTSTLPSIFPKITSCRQFLRKMWQIQLVLLLYSL